jgi:hypothetical protein
MWLPPVPVQEYATSKLRNMLEPVWPWKATSKLGDSVGQFEAPECRCRG